MCSTATGRIKEANQNASIESSQVLSTPCASSPRPPKINPTRLLCPKIMPSASCLPSFPLHTMRIPISVCICTLRRFRGSSELRQPYTNMLASTSGSNWQSCSTKMKTSSKPLYKTHDRFPRQAQTSPRTSSRCYIYFGDETYCNSRWSPCDNNCICTFYDGDTSPVCFEHSAQFTRQKFGRDILSC